MYTSHVHKATNCRSYDMEGALVVDVAT
jgi:hypothetical protein